MKVACIRKRPNNKVPRCIELDALQFQRATVHFKAAGGTTS